MFHVRKEKTPDFPHLRAFLTKALGTRAHLINELQEGCQNFAKAVFLAFSFAELKKTPAFKSEERRKIFGGSFDNLK